MIESRGRPFGAIGTALALAALYAVSAGLRIYLTVTGPYFDGRDPSGLYWSESALQYHYAERVGRGEGIPPNDLKAQMPEGLRVWDELTIGMELVVGGLYQVASLAGFHASFHWYSVVAVACIGALAVFGVFGLGREIWGRNEAGLFAAALWVLCPASYLRGIAGFLLETFALPLLLGGIAAAIYAVRNGRRGGAMLAGALFWAALMSWHMSGFVLALLVAGTVIGTHCFPRERRALLGVLAAAATAIVLAGLLSPALRHKHFLAGPLPIFLIAFLVMQAKRIPVVLGEPWRAMIGAGAVAGCALWLMRLLGWGRPGEYGNVSGLLLAKIRWLGIKPDDPGLLSWDARSSWIDAFASPAPESGLLSLGWLAVFALFGLGPLLNRLRRANGFAVSFLAGFVVLSAMLYLAFERMEIFFAVALAGLAAGALADRGEGGVGRPGRASRVTATLLLVAVGCEVAKAFFVGIEFRRPVDQRDFLTWFREKTEPDAVVLAPMAMGPSILAYSGRAIVLHSKFEAAAMREKVRRYTEALFYEESEFAALCERWGVDYVVHDGEAYADHSTDSVYYLAGRRALPARSVFRAFHMTPEVLRRFRLVYQDRTRRVFRFVPDSGSDPVRIMPRMR
jgi:hypothetical protein